jgi:hypothetical protein
MCDKEFDSKRSTARFCSDACRVNAARKKELEYEEDDFVYEEPDNSDLIAAGKEIEEIMAKKPVKELSREELYDAIGQYPKDTWKDSPEYQELLDRIEAMTVQQLRDGGYSVPARKANEGKAETVSKKIWSK